MAKTTKPGAARRPRKRERKNITFGVAHIKSSFNNTIISIADPEGNVLAWASAGNVGFKAKRDGRGLGFQETSANRRTTAATTSQAAGRIASSLG